MWDLSRPGMESVSPALAGRFFTIWSVLTWQIPCGKPAFILLLERISYGYCVLIHSVSVFHMYCSSIVLKVLTDIFGFVLQLVCSLFFLSSFCFCLHSVCEHYQCPTFICLQSLCVWSSGDYIPTLDVHSLLGALVEHENLTLA